MVGMVEKSVCDCVRLCCPDQASVLPWRYTTFIRVGQSEPGSICFLITRIAEVCLAFGRVNNSQSKQSMGIVHSRTSAEPVTRRWRGDVGQVRYSLAARAYGSGSANHGYSLPATLRPALLLQILPCKVCCHRLLTHVV